MLAATLTPATFDKIKFPVIASPKVDGIRAVTLGNQVMSRKLIALPNRYLQDQLAADRARLVYLDGEIMTYTNGVMDPFHTVQSKVMSVNGGFMFKWLVFDDFHNPEQPYVERQMMSSRCYASEFCITHESARIDDIEQLVRYEELIVSKGYEGICLRSPQGQYKQGRSTLNEGGLLKLKSFADAEGRVIGVVPLEVNANELSHDALGYAKRANMKSSMEIDWSRVGALTIDTRQWGVFNIGSGYTDRDRRMFMDMHNQGLLVNQIVTFKYQPHGTKNKPRTPIFKSFRDPRI